MKQFTTAARRGAAAVLNPVTIEFLLDDVTMTATPPTAGQLALYLAHQTDRGTGGIRAMFDFLTCVLDDASYRTIEDKLRDGLDVMLLVEIIQYLVEEWSGRPTSPLSVSSASPPSIGDSSMERPLAEASTTSI